MSRVTPFIEDFKKAGVFPVTMPAGRRVTSSRLLHREIVSKTKKVEYEEMFGFGSLWRTHGSQTTEGLLEHTLLASQTFRLGRPWVGSLMCTGFSGLLVTMLKGPHRKLG